jgi:hypothetical protein
LHQQIGGSNEAGAKPGLRCTISQRDSKMGFANATGSEEHDILGTLHKGKTAEFENQSFRYADRKLEVEFIKRLDCRKPARRVSIRRIRSARAIASSFKACSRKSR